MIRFPYASRRLEISGFSSRGRIRESNADDFLIADLSLPRGSLRADPNGAAPVCSESGSYGQLLMVADGIGTGLGGGRASRIVVDELVRYLAATGGRPAEDPATTLGELVNSLRESQRTMDRVCADTSLRSMGTTVTMACILGATLYVLHAGDSRCYLVREGRMRCLTTDHTLAQQLVDHHCLSPEMARHSRLQHVLWNAITADSQSFELDSVARKLRPDDLLLLCTDGLTKHLTDDDLLAVAEASRSAEEVTGRLVEMALAAGGTDNVTVISARCHRQHATPVPSPRTPPATEQNPLNRATSAESFPSTPRATDSAAHPRCA